MSSYQFLLYLIQFNWLILIVPILLLKIISINCVSSQTECDGYFMPEMSDILKWEF